MYTTKRVEKYLNMAKEASKNSDFVQHRLGSVIVYKGMPLATSCNSTKTNPTQKFYNRERKGFDVDASCSHTNSLHSEIACLLKVRDLEIDFSKCSIFVYRETADGKRALSRPCEACRAAIKAQGIRDVYYTVEDGWAHEHWEDKV